MSWSATTEVSSNLMVGSAIGGLIHDHIQIGTHYVGIDARSASRRLGNHRPKHEPPLWNRAEFGRRYSVSGDDDRLTGLDLAENRAGVSTELSSGSDPAHGELRVAFGALCSNLATASPDAAALLTHSRLQNGIP